MPTIVPNTDPTALLSGDFWTGFAQNPTPTPVIVTYSFPTSLPASDASVPNFTAATDASFRAFSAAEQGQAVAALGEWAAASQLVFVQVAPGKGDINFSNVDFSTLAKSSTDAGIGYNPFGDWNVYSKPYFTTDLTYAGDVFMNSAYQNGDGTVSYATLLHEVGHAIGLKHPTQTVDDYSTGVFEDNVLAVDDPSVTIMSTHVDAGDLTNPHILPLDMSAAAAIYGAPGAGTAGTPTGPGEVITATSGTVTGSNSVSIWSWNADTQTMTQTAATADDVIHGTSVNDVIYAGNGTDSLFGLDGNNTLYGGTSASSVDYLYGGPDSDTLNGGAGTNTFYAGTGTEIMNGSAGTNTFHDGGGIDTINAKGTNDTFYVSSANTTISEANPSGSSTIYANGLSYTMPVNVSSMTMTGTQAGFTGTANDDASVSLFGNGSYASTLIAGTGADYIVGGSANDTLVAGSGSDTLYGNGGANTFVFNSAADTHTTIGDFAEGTDKIDLSGLAQSLGVPLSFIGSGPFTHQAGQVESFVNGSATVVAVDTTGNGAADFQITVFDGAMPLLAGDFNLGNTACYCAGTRILTERGEAAIETLKIGDRVLTLSGIAQPIRWIGRRRYSADFAAGNRDILPIRIAQGALGDGLPARDLMVSPEHALYIDEMLIPAAALVNGGSIAQVEEAVGDVTYFHLEFDAHAVIYAEGAPAESFVDDESRGMFDNADEYAARYPDAAPKPARFCAPRVEDGWELEAVRQRLAGVPPQRAFSNRIGII